MNAVLWCSVSAHAARYSASQQRTREKSHMKQGTDKEDKIQTRSKIKTSSPICGLQLQIPSVAEDQNIDFCDGCGWGGRSE